MSDYIPVTRSGKTYKVDIAPSWATGPIDIEFNYPKDVARINDIPGFPSQLRSQGRLWSFYDEMADERVELCSDNCPEDDLGCEYEPRLFVWGDDRLEDMTWFHVYTYSRMHEIVDFYNTAVQGSVCKSINGAESPFANIVPDLGTAYFFREEGLIVNDTWLFRDQDIERWRTQRITNHICGDL